MCACIECTAPVSVLSLYISLCATACVSVLNEGAVGTHTALQTRCSCPYITVSCSAPTVLISLSLSLSLLSRSVSPSSRWISLSLFVIVSHFHSPLLRRGTCMARIWPSRNLSHTHWLSLTLCSAPASLRFCVTLSSLRVLDHVKTPELCMTYL